MDITKRFDIPNALTTLIFSIRFSACSVALIYHHVHFFGQTEMQKRVAPRAQIRWPREHNDTDEAFDAVGCSLSKDERLAAQDAFLSIFTTDIRANDVIMNVLPLHVSLFVPFTTARLVCKIWSRRTVNHRGILNCVHEGGRDKFYLVNAPVAPNNGQTMLLASIACVRLDEASVTWFSELYNPSTMPHLRSITMNMGSLAVSQIVMAGLSQIFQKQQQLQTSQQRTWEVYLYGKDDPWSNALNINNIRAVSAVLLWMDSGVCFSSLAIALTTLSAAELVRMFKHPGLKHVTLAVNDDQRYVKHIEDNIVTFMTRNQVRNPKLFKQSPLIPLQSLTLTSTNVYPFFLLSHFLLSYIVEPTELAFCGPRIGDYLNHHLPYPIDTLHLVNPNGSTLAVNWVLNFLVRQVPVRKLVIVRPSFELRHLQSGLAQATAIRELELVNPDTYIREVDLHAMKKALTHSPPNLEMVSIQGVDNDQKPFIQDEPSHLPYVKHFVAQMKGPFGSKCVANNVPKDKYTSDAHMVRRRVTCQRSLTHGGKVQYSQDVDRFPAWRWKLDAPRHL
jgi:hypothetical protein